MQILNDGVKQQGGASKCGQLAAHCFLPFWGKMARRMNVPLIDCTIDEQSTLARFLSTERVKPAGISCRILAQYESCTMNQGNMYKWIRCFKSGRTSVKDNSRSSHLSRSRTKEHIYSSHALFSEDVSICGGNRWHHLRIVHRQ